MAKNGDDILSRSEFAHLLRHGSLGCAQHEALRLYVKALDAKRSITAQLAARDATIADLTSALAHEKDCRLSQLAAMSRKLAARDAEMVRLRETARAGWESARLLSIAQGRSHATEERANRELDLLAATAPRAEEALAPSFTIFNCIACDRSTPGKNDGSFDTPGWRRVDHVDGNDSLCPDCVADLPETIEWVRRDYPNAELRAEGDGR